MATNFRRNVVGAGIAIGAAAALWAGNVVITTPALAHQEVDPALVRQVKPRRGAKPDFGMIRQPGDPLVEEGRRLFFEETFGGNGRTCGTCHRAEQSFTIDAPFIRRLPKSDPLFVAEANPALAGLENPRLLRQHGLILENLDGFDQPGVMRSVPHTLGLRLSTGPADGVPLAGATGWSGDGAPGQGTLGEFAIGAVVQHMPRSLQRRAGVDFRLPTQDELDAMLAFQLSLGRQQEMNVAPSAMTFLDPFVTAGQTLFHGAAARDGSTRTCSGCHGNAGANGSDGDGLNTDTGVRSAPNAPACLDPTAPGDGGFASEPVQAGTLCGRQVMFRGNGQFNVPSIIEAADTAPFFHNNIAATIEGAVRFYTSDTFNASTAGAGRAFVLDAAQVNQVAGFLRALNAVANIDDARRSLDGATGRPTPSQRRNDQAFADIEDAIDVLERGPVKLFKSTGAVKTLRDAQRLARQGQIEAARTTLGTARGQIVASQ